MCECVRVSGWMVFHLYCKSERVTAVIRENRTLFCYSPKGYQPNKNISVFLSPSSELSKEELLMLLTETVDDYLAFCITL